MNERDISFVIPCYRSTATIEKVIIEIEETVQKLGLTYEVVLVNDSSPDDTWTTLKRIACTHSNITVINLARNFGQHAAIMAGLRSVNGKYVCCLDDDGQTPVNELEKFLLKINEGYDVVYAEYEIKKHSGFRNIGSRVNAKMTEYLLDKPKTLYISSYFVMKKFVSDEILSYKHSYPYLMGLVLRTTKNITNVKVTHRERSSGDSGYNVKKLLSLWMNGFTAFSVKPLRIATGMGVLFSVTAFLWAIIIILKKILGFDVVLGYTSIIVCLSFFFGIIMIMLGLIGEYIGRIYISINNAPQYVIKEIYDQNKENL